MASLLSFLIQFVILFRPALSAIHGTVRYPFGRYERPRHRQGGRK